jgi:hypothetical protein
MRKIFVGFFIVILLILTIEPISGDINFNSLNTTKAIFLEIDEIQDKTLNFDDVIGDIHVKYWEHEINGIYVKNDSILLHIDIDSGDVINYEIRWTDVDFVFSDYSGVSFEPIDFFWKKLVVFPDEEDCSYFYNFYGQVNYPLLCWEVRHKDGSTILYDIDGVCIGYGIPAPFQQGFSISCDCSDGYGDCWSRWRENADRWFQEWCDSTINIGLPSLEEISSNIQNQNVKFFYELGHSHYLPTRFLITDGVYYFASQLEDDMFERQPMKFAFIGSCEGLREIDRGTLSYEFRKGEMNGTVTVGYVGMASCPGWSVSVDWQNKMFLEMDSGFTIKEAFDLASAEYPSIANCVRFVGDENLVVGNNPPCSPMKPIGSAFNPPNKILYFNTTTFDPEGDPIYYLFDWDDGSDSGWLGPYHYGEYVAASHFWKNNGKYFVKVKAKDENDAESKYSNSLEVTITNPPNKPNKPVGPSFGITGKIYTFTTSTNDPDGDSIYYLWNWGDGNLSEWLSTNEASYSWEQAANFNISVKAKDNYGAESEWSDPLSFRILKNKLFKTSFLLFIETLLQNHPFLFPLLKRLI